MIAALHLTWFKSFYKSSYKACDVQLQRRTKIFFFGLCRSVFSSSLVFVYRHLLAKIFLNHYIIPKSLISESFNTTSCCTRLSWKRSQVTSKCGKYCTVPQMIPNRKWSPTANDPETANDPQNGPQMILDGKWSPKLTANDPVETWGMEWILWDWLQKRTDYKKGTFFSRPLKKKGRRTLHFRSIYTRRKKVE